MPDYEIDRKYPDHTSLTEIEYTKKDRFLTQLEKIVKENNVRTFKTIGNHNRYFRDDLPILHKTILTKQNNG